MPVPRFDIAGEVEPFGVLMGQAGATAIGGLVPAAKASTTQASVSALTLNNAPGGM